MSFVTGHASFASHRMLPFWKDLFRDVASMYTTNMNLFTT